VAGNEPGGGPHLGAPRRPLGRAGDGALEAAGLREQSRNTALDEKRNKRRAPVSRAVSGANFPKTPASHGKRNAWRHTARAMSRENVELVRQFTEGRFRQRIPG
jgi:hypothetical protein